MTDEQTTQESTADRNSDEAASSEFAARSDGPGWLPAIMAATALMGIFGFIVCAFSTWVLFQKRTEFAIRTLDSALIPELEQSRLDPVAKASMIKQAEKLVADMKRGKYENWQSAGIMQRLQRLPILHWGDLRAVETFLVNTDPPDLAESRKQLSRLRQAVEMGNATSFDFEDVLTPVYVAAPDLPSGHQLISPLTIESAMDVVNRARLLADREQVPDQSYEDVRIESIMRREIESAAIDGGF